MTLTPADFKANIESLSAKWNCQISPEEGMSSLMYPKVFDDFMKAREKKSDIVRFIPTLVYFYGMLPGSKFEMTLPFSKLSPGALSDLKVDNQSQSGASDDIKVTIVLERISPLKEKHRTVIFKVNGKEQHVNVKDTSGVFVFEGPMAVSSDNNQIASPMPGVIEKLLVVEGQSINAGDTLCTVSAMKMEVKVTAPHDCKIASITVAPGTRVVEGALLLTLKK